MESNSVKFVRRVNVNDYIEDQTITIGDGGGSDTVTNLLKGEELTAYEFEIDGKMVVLLGFDTKR